MLGEPDFWRRCDDDAIPPPAVEAALWALYRAGKPLVYAGERYAMCWRLSL